MSPQAYCRHICKHSRSNFVYSFYFLSAKQRRAMEAFYAFCTTVDDVVDTQKARETSAEMLLAWRREVARMYRGLPEHPVALALSPFLKAFSVPQHYLEDIISGCEMDLEQNRYATFSELEQYCYRVASCVGMVCLFFFGIEPTEVNNRAAIAMGKALQMTNIIRDVMHDMTLQRVYLPEEDMNHCGVSVADIMHRRNEPGLVSLFNIQISRARGFFTEAFTESPMKKSERKKWLPALLIGRIYENLLDQIEQNPLVIFEQRTQVPRWGKLKIIGRTLKEIYL